jgi:hypothetical protein
MDIDVGDGGASGPDGKLAVPQQGASGGGRRRKLSTAGKVRYRFYQTKESDSAGLDG